MKYTDFLNKHLEDTDLIHCLMMIFEAVRSVSDHLDITKGHRDDINVHGERQLEMDVQADKIVTDSLCQCSCVAQIASEEQECAVRLNGDKFCVVFDPLDGSSLVDANMSIGSIFGIYPGKELIGRKGDELVGALSAIYGPRTTVMMSFGDGVHEFILKDDRFELKLKDIKLAKKGTYFAPGNLRAAKTTPWYRELVNYWLDERYTLRYSGGMCADINHILVKGQGVFTYPGSTEIPEGKLRLLYECGPTAYLIEQAAGCASDGNVRILEKEITSLHERTPILIGSCDDVDKCIEYMRNFT